jgi:hypothetical protein
MSDNQARFSALIAANAEMVRQLNKLVDIVTIQDKRIAELERRLDSHESSPDSHESSQ